MQARMLSGNWPTAVNIVSYTRKRASTTHSRCRSTEVYAILRSTKNTNREFFKSCLGALEIGERRRPTSKIYHFTIQRMCWNSPQGCNRSRSRYNSGSQSHEIVASFIKPPALLMPLRLNTVCLCCVKIYFYTR